MRENPYGLNGQDLPRVSIGYAVTSIIMGAVIDNPDPWEEVWRLCDVLEQALVQADIHEQTAKRVAENVENEVYKKLRAIR
jgi:hypothetical protein